MPDTDTDTTQSESSQASSSKSFVGGGGLPEIKIGKLFANVILIKRIKIDGQEFLGQGNVSVKAGSSVEIYGDNLNLIDSVALRQGYQDVTTPESLNFSDSSITFRIPTEFFEINLPGGGVLNLEFKSAFNSALNCRLYNRLIYKTSKQNEENTEEINSKSKSGGGSSNPDYANSENNFAGPTGTAMAATGNAFSAVGKAFIPSSLNKSVNRDRLKKAVKTKDTKAVKSLIEQFEKDGDAEGLEEIYRESVKNNADVEIQGSLKDAIEKLRIANGGELKTQVSQTYNVKSSAGPISVTDDYDTEVESDISSSQLSEGGAQVSQDAQIENTIDVSGQTSSEVETKVDANINSTNSAEINTQTQVKGDISTAPANTEAEVNVKNTAEVNTSGSVSVPKENLQSTGSAESKTESNISSNTQASVKTTGSQNAQASSSENVSGKAELKSSTEIKGQNKVSISGGDNSLPQQSPEGINTKKSPKTDTENSLEQESGQPKQKNINNSVGQKENKKVTQETTLPNTPVGQSIDSVGTKKEKLQQEKSPKIPTDIAQKLGNLKENDALLKGVARGGKGKGKELLKPNKKVGNVNNLSGQKPESTQGNNSKNKSGENVRQSSQAGNQNNAERVGQGQSTGVGNKEEVDSFNKENLGNQNNERQDLAQKPKNESGENLTSEEELQQDEDVLPIPKKIKPQTQESLVTARNFFGGKKKNKGLFGNLFNTASTAKNLASGASVAAEAGTAVVAGASATLPFILTFLAILLIGGFFFIVIIYGGCNFPTTTSKLDRRLSYMGAAGQAKICEYIDNTSIGQSLNSQLGNSPTSGIGPEGLLSTGKWTDAINSAVAKYPPTDACILRVVVQKESGGQEDVIGCDCAYNGKPQFCPNSKQSNKYFPGFPFNWDQCSYGIGITQWTIYQKSYANMATDFRRWQSSDLPSRTPFGQTFYTVNDFLNPQISLELTADKFARELKKSGGNVSSAFGAYVGASSSQQKFVEERMALYNMCKQNSGQ
jgi:hypothetical protein